VSSVLGLTLVVLGAKLFDLRVLAGAWSASPPESLAMLPYGPRWPVDTGEFFIPSSAALLVSSVGAVVAGWKTRPWYRALLLVPPGISLGTLMFTVLWFWPANRALWHVAINASDAMTDREQIIALTRRWISYDWLRVTLASIGLVCSVRALSTPFPDPDPSAAPPSLAMKVVYVLGLAAVVAFVAYFLLKGLA
jgi:hypothetical protein